MEGGIFTYLIFIGVLIFGVYVLCFFVPLGIWFTAQLSGVRISLIDLIDMKIRRVAPAPIVRSLIMAAKAGIDIQKDSLEAHTMAGGNVENVMKGLIMARNKDMDLSFRVACKLDLAGKDLTKTSPISNH